MSRPSQATSEDGFPLNCAHACSLQTLPFIIDSLALQTSRPRGLCSGGLETEHSQELPVTLGMTPRANSQLSGNWNQASKHIHKRASRPQVALRRAGMHYLYCVCWQGRPIVTVGRPTLGAGDPGLYEREGGERQCVSLALCSGLWLRSAAVNPCYLDFLTRMTDCTRSKSGPFSLKTSSSVFSTVSGIETQSRCTVLLRMDGQVRTESKYSGTFTRVQDPWQQEVLACLFCKLGHGDKAGNAV